MKGAEFLTRSRLDGHDVGMVHIMVTDARLPFPPVFVGERGTTYEVAVKPGEVMGALDLRCVQGVPVTVFAPTYDSARGLLMRLDDFEPSYLALVSSDVAIRYTRDGEMEQWEL